MSRDKIQETAEVREEEGAEVQAESTVAEVATPVQGFSVDAQYTGYTFVGWAAGMFEAQDGSKHPYANMYVLTPVSDYSSEDYTAWGLKAEKKKCLSPAVWEGLTPGDRVKLFFDDRQRVVMAALDG